MSGPSPASAVDAEIAFHEAECGGYRADLPHWERLAAATDLGVLDLGAGSGRVALHLAARGAAVTAIDSDPALIAELIRRADEAGLEVEALVADVRDLELDRRFGLIVAPMQLTHLLGGGRARARAWRAITGHLAPDGVLALAVLREPLPPSGRPEPIPDVREVEGWVHSSLPLAVRVSDERVELDRLRQVVSPAGALSEELTTTTLERLRPAELQEELAEAGLRVRSAEPIAATDEHVASLLVIAERSDA